MRRLRGADASFIFQENRVQHQHTIKVAVIDPSTAHTPVTYERIREGVAQTIPHLEPFRWRLVKAPFMLGLPWWAEDPDLDIDYHVRRAAAVAPGGDRELAEVISTIASTPLERDRPLWQTWVVEGLEHGHIAFVMKVHHSLADGLSSAKLLMATFSESAEPLEMPDLGGLETERVPGRPRLAAKAIRHSATVTRGLPSLVRRTARVSKLILARRRSDEAQQVRAFASPPTRFNAPLTPHRWFAYTSLDLNQIKEVKDGLGGTINDVFLATVSGAVREYLLQHGELPDTTLTCTVPVSVRQPHEMGEWGNRLATWFVALATDVENPVERLHAISEVTATCKEILAERDSELQSDWMEIWPAFRAYSHWLPAMASRAANKPSFNLIVSNVPGPRAQLYQDGSRLVKVISMGPLVSVLGLNFTGWSYMDELTVGVVGCRETVPDIWGLADGLQPALDELTKSLKGPA